MQINSPWRLISERQLPSIADVQNSQPNFGLRHNADLHFAQTDKIYPENMQEKSFI